MFNSLVNLLRRDDDKLRQLCLEILEVYTLQRTDNQIFSYYYSLNIDKVLLNAMQSSRDNTVGSQGAANCDFFVVPFF